nr:RNA-directed DNA polymerase, eukaryota, reverse transcriptase zinc-binding domain protein [Tanacetum cinerariifolium]
NLQSFDLSHNGLSGDIPGCFGNFTAMATNKFWNDMTNHLYSLQEEILPMDTRSQGINGWVEFIDSELVAWKGTKHIFGKTVLGLLISIDLSNNNFSGKLPSEFDGTIIAPTKANAWGKGLLQWLEFTKLVGLTIKGKGTVDGRAYRLRINMCKSKIMGVHVDGDMVNRAAGKLGCLVLETPFSYLGSIVGGYVSRKQTWNDIPERVKKRLCKWKMQTFSIGGRLTKKATWVNWKKVLLSKDRGGLGVSSLYAMNRGLLFKWIWRFFTQGNTLWARVIKAIHGADGRIGAILSVGISSCWTTITHEISLSKKGIDLMEYMHIKEMETLRFSGRISGVKRVFLKIGIFFFSCGMAREVVNLITRWWNVPNSDFDSYEEWLAWLVNVRLPSKNKKMLEGVFYVMWWLHWWLRNKTIFEGKTPKKEIFLMI